MKSGIPETGEHDIVETDQLRIYVSRGMIYSGDIPRIVVFPRRNGERDVGVPNVIKMAEQ